MDGAIYILGGVFMSMNVASVRGRKRGKMKKIIDEYTDLKVSRQRKWQLRHKKEANEILNRFKKSNKHFKEWSRKYQREYYLKNKVHLYQLRIQLKIRKQLDEYEKQS